MRTQICMGLQKPLRCSSTRKSKTDGTIGIFKSFCSYLAILGLYTETTPIFYSIVDSFCNPWQQFGPEWFAWHHPVFTMKVILSTVFDSSLAWNSSPHRKFELWFFAGQFQPSKSVLAIRIRSLAISSCRVLGDLHKFYSPFTCMSWLGIAFLSCRLAVNSFAVRRGFCTASIACTDSRSTPPVVNGQQVENSVWLFEAAYLPIVFFPPLIWLCTDFQHLCTWLLFALV